MLSSLTTIFYVSLRLTMSIDVPQLIVQIEEAFNALLDGGDRSIAGQDIFVKL